MNPHLSALKPPGMPARGLFVSFEGSEGCGKSTQIQLLKTRLEELGQTAEFTREPGGTALGEAVRHLLQFAPEGEGMCPESELLLFAASRAQLVREKLAPILESGTHVLADRFLDSTTVYQGMARGLDLESVTRINHFAVGESVPDVTFVLDIDAEVALKRARSNSKQRDRMESEPMEFYQLVREGYLKLAQEGGERFVLLNAEDSIESLGEKIWEVLRPKLAG